MWCIKQLLGVRKTTSNNLCLIEHGYPPLRALITARQRRFFTRMWRERRDMEDDPLAHVIRLTLGYNCYTSRYLNDILNIDTDDITQAVYHLKRKQGTSESPRVQLYRTINSEFTVHELYKTKIEVKQFSARTG